MYETFVSFDYDNDRQYKYLLEAWNKNPNFNFTFLDRSSFGVCLAIWGASRQRSVGDELYRGVYS